MITEKAGVSSNDRHRSSIVRPHPTRRKLLASAAGLMAAALTGGVGQAQTPAWPARPVTVIVPYAAGGNSDMMARLVTKRLGEKFGQSFVIENRGGAAGTIGAAAVARAEPDGYTLLWGASTQMINVPFLQKVNYDPDKDFIPVSVFGTGPYILGINASLPVKTVPEFVAHVKANPGKLNYATAGHGGNVHLNTALFVTRAGLDMMHVPYKSGAPAMNGLAAGEIEMYFGNASELIQQVSNNRVKLIAVSTAQRMPKLPDMPTVAEFYPGFQTSSWNGFFAPAGTPKAIVEALARETIAAAKDPEIADRLHSLGILPVGNTPAEFAELINRDKSAHREAMKAAGMKTE